MSERALYTVLLIFLVLFTPYWIYLPAIFLGMILFPLYSEAILLSAFVDYYYGAHTYAGTPLAFPFAIAAALLLLALVELKERMRITL